MTPSDLAKVAGKVPLSKSTLARNMEQSGAGGGVESRHATLPSNSTDSDKVSCAGAEVKAANLGSFGSRSSDRPARTKKRLRQSTKPLMNKLEQEFFNWLSPQHPNYPRPRAQAKRYRLGNGVNYTPDVTSSCWPDDVGPARETAWEVKGEKSWDDAIVKIKMAATIWPEVNWWIVWKNGTVWAWQRVLP